MEGEEGKDLVLLLSGEAVIKVGGATVYKFEKGAIIGESGVAKKTFRRNATVLAGSSKVQVLVITQEKLSDIRIEMPEVFTEIYMNLLNMAIEKLGFANDTIQQKIEAGAEKDSENLELTRELEHKNWLRRLAVTLGFSQA